MNLRFYIFIITLLCSLDSFGKEITVRGQVIDALSRQPVAGAVIIADERKELSDDWGNFQISAHSTITITHVGYKTEVISTISSSLTVTLQPDAISLEQITVLADNRTTFRSIAKTDLLLRPVKNTQELLRIVPGLFIAQHAGGGKAEQIFLRGFDCDHGTDIAVGIDGMPVNMVSHAHGQGYADAHFIIPETINTIQYGTGPYYSDQGNLNTAGYVSFQSYKSIDKSIVQLEAGNFHTFRTLAMIDLLKKNKDDESAYVASDYTYSNGPSLEPQHFNRLSFFGKYNRALTKRTDVSVSFSSFDSKWNASGQVPERAVNAGIIDRFGSIDPSEGGNTQRHSINVSLAHRFTNDWTLHSQIYYSRYLFNLYSNFTFYLNDPLHGDEINQYEKRDLYGTRFSISKKFFLKGFTIQSDYALGSRYDHIPESRLSHAEKRKFLSDETSGAINELNGYAYTSQKITSGKWIFESGLRYDLFHFHYSDQLTGLQNNQYKTIISPKASVYYQFNEQIQGYVKWGKGFHSNDTRVVIAERGKQILPEAYGTDIGINWKPFPQLFINAAAWRLNLEQEFVYAGDDGAIEPSGRSMRRGLDLLLRYRYTPELFLNLNLNLTQGQLTDAPKGSNYIPLAPLMTSTGGIFYKRTKGWNGSISWRYIKDRPANEDNSITAKGYFLLDANIGYTTSAIELGMAIENMTNVTWNEAQFATTSQLKNEAVPVTELNFTPGNPIQVRFKMAYHF